MCAATGYSGPGQRGVVLVTVLWMLVLLSLMATGISLGGRSFVRQTLNIEQGYRAALAADAGISWALWSLQPGPQGRWLADGSEHELQLGEARVRVALFDESGKLDLNLAPSELLDALLEPAIADSRQRAALVAAIEDWRDSDDLVRLNGAEEAEYLAAGRDKGPANRPFRDLIELAEVLGMNERIYRSIVPSLTLSSGVRTINPQVAPYAVLMALPNASDGVVRSFIEARRSAWDSALPAPPLPFDAAPYVSERGAGRNFTALSEAQLGRWTRVRHGVLIERRASVPRVVRSLLLLDDTAGDDAAAQPGDQQGDGEGGYEQ